MEEKKKDRLLIVGAICAIILVGYLILNIDRLFPAPDVDLSIPQKVSTQFNTMHGTNTAAKVTVIEFSDFQCPFCKDNVGDVKKLLAAYGDRVNFVYKHFPISQIHPYAWKAAEASECARDQGKFWQYHDILFDNQDALSEGNLIRYAQDAGLDGEQFAACLQSGTKNDLVEQDFAEGVQAGVEGTPSFFINGNKLEGVQSFEQLKLLIDAELQG